MELLLICPLGFDLPPDIVAAKLCENPLLHHAPRELIVSSDCLAFAPAFHKQLNSKLIVDYTWDNQHTGSAEPDRIEGAYYQADVWYGAESNEGFLERLWDESSTQRNPKRVVLCGQGVISTISASQLPLAICKFQVQRRVSVSVLASVSFEEVNLLFTALKPPAAAQAIAATVVQTITTALREGKAANVSFQAQLTDLLTQQVTGAMNSLEQHYSEKVNAAVQAVQAKQEEYQSCITQLNQLLETIETDGRQIEETMKGFQQAKVPSALKNVGVGAVDQRLSGTMKEIEQFETQLKVLYGDMQVKKPKKRPLTLEIEANGVCKVENSKRYALESLELWCSVEGQASQELLKFRAPVGGSQHSFQVAIVPGKKLTFVIRQGGREVSEPFEAVPDVPQPRFAGSMKEQNYLKPPPPPPPSS